MQVNKWKVSYKYHIKRMEIIFCTFCVKDKHKNDLCEISMKWCILLMGPRIWGNENIVTNFRAHLKLQSILHFIKISFFLLFFTCPVKLFNINKLTLQYNTYHVPGILLTALCTLIIYSSPGLVAQVLAHVVIQGPMLRRASTWFNSLLSPS